MIDLHSDTIYSLWCRDDGSTIKKNDLSIRKETLIKAGVRGQCLALFTPMHEHIPEKKRSLSPWQIVSELHDRFVKETESAGIPLLTDPEELKDGRLHAILTTEEGAAIEGDISRLSTLRSWGVRIFGLTWNYENELAYPNSTDPDIMTRGLKKKGFEAIEECSRLGILIDVSHLSDGGFYDVASHMKGPFLATHSNARAITDVPRNLTDMQLKTLAGNTYGPTVFDDNITAIPRNTQVNVLAKINTDVGLELKFEVANWESYDIIVPDFK